jgi:transcriptional regulator with AAA-type ATPase domain/predicted ATPase
MKARLDALLGENSLIIAIRTQVAELLARQTAAHRLPPVLILGETGTGKGLLARTIHQAGPRHDHPFVAVNCAAIPETLLEAELFGFERGAFTDARQAKPGLFQTAHGGTLFLDEIGLLPAALQGKLLSVLEDRAVRRLGRTRAERVDVTLVAATSVDLKRAIADGRFREDLYHRLAVITLELPPLRSRGADILELAEHFLARACADYGLSPRALTPDAHVKLATHRWPGNVRELANAMERVALLSDTAEITAAMIDFPTSDTAQVADTSSTAIAGSLDDALRARIEAALHDTGGNIRRSAAALGISRNTLRARMDRYGLRHHHAPPVPKRLAESRSQARQVGADVDRAVGVCPPTLSTPRHNLPAPLNVFIGRETELTEIRRLLLEEADCRLLTLVGPGGIGKTRLALRVAETLLATQTEHARFAQGIFFVPVEAVNAASGIVTAILSVLAEESGFAIQAAASLQEQLLDFLRTRALLLVLDNLEHLVGEVDVLAAILTTAPAVKILVTSRVAMNLQQEWFRPVAGMAYPREGDEQDTVMGGYDAVRLFEHHARRARSDFSLAVELAHVLRICSLVDGTPLALELAAAWLKGLPCQQIVCELERGLDILAARHQDIPVRHRNMRTVLEQSWRLLAPEEEDALTRLAVFQGGFTQVAARVIVDASPVILTRLVEKSMVRMTTPGRYRMHELLRQFATERLQDTWHTHDAYSRYFVTFAQERYTAFLDKRYPEAIKDLSDERDNLRAAWQWLMEQARARAPSDDVLERLAAFVHPLAWFYRERALTWEAKAVFRAACTAIAAVLGQGEWPSAKVHRMQVLLARLQIRLASFLYFLGEYEQVDQTVAAALPVVRASHLTEEEGLALEAAARAHLRRGNYQATKTAAQRSMALACQAGSDLHAMDAVVLLARTAAAEGDYDLAIRLHQRTVEYYRHLNYAVGTARALANLGNTHVLRGDYAAAQPLFETAHAMAQENNNRFLVIVTGTNLGIVMLELGRYAEATAHFRKNLVLVREAGDQRWLAVNLNHLSLADLHMNDLDGAQRHAQQALAVAHSIRCEPDVLSSIAYLAHVWARRGNPEAALRALLYVDSTRPRRPGTNSSTRPCWQRCPRRQRPT